MQKIHAMPNGQGTALLHPARGYMSRVSMVTLKHERTRERHRCEGSLGEDIPCVPSIRRMIEKKSEERRAEFDAVY